MLETTLDLAKLPDPAVTSTARAAFDGLTPDDTLVLETGGPPFTLLRQLERERPGLLDWSLLEEGPVRWRVVLRRRPPSEPAGVSAYLGWDHRRLSALMADVRARLATGELAAAACRFAEFRTGLLRHIAMEEEVLFPEFEQLTGMTGGPTVVMRQEHLEIRRLLQETTSSLAAGDGAAAERSRAALQAVLTEHDMKEEGVLYPMTDEALDGDAPRAALVRRLREV